MPSEIQEPSLCLKDFRILVLFGGGRLFGQERGNIEVFRALRADGMKARFLISRLGLAEIAPELNRHQLDWRVASFGYAWQKWLFKPPFCGLIRNLLGSILSNLRFLIEQYRWIPTHLYTPNYLFFSFVWPSIAWSGIPLVVRAGDVPTVHTTFHRWLMHKLCARSSVIVCNSDYVKREYLRFGVPPSKLRLIYNHPPVRPKGLAKPAIPLETGKTVIAYMGQLSEQKGVHLLVQAVGLLRERGVSDFEVWLVGEPGWGTAFADSIKALVDQKGLEDCVHLLGYQANVPAVLARTHLHVCPSVWEDPAPNVVLEAKREGLPSVVFPTGGLPELIRHKVDGYICIDCSVAALCEGLQWFLGDAGERRRAGEAARRSLEDRFGQERFIKEWTAVFRETVREPERKGMK